MANNIGRVDFLISDPEKFKEKVGKRLQIGKEFASRKMSTEEDSSNCWKEFIKWDHYNLEMLKQAFEFPDNAYATDYDRNRSFGGGIYIPGARKEPTLEESIQSTRNEMAAQVWKFERFYDKIDLLKVKIDPNHIPQNSSLHNLLGILNRFHKVAQELRGRRMDREPVIIQDEYDVQYLLAALLKLHFNDIRPEESSPSHAGSNSRIDFVLREERIIIETKMTSEKFRIKNLGEELLVDIGRYKEYPGCDHLVIFVYDKGDHILNKRGFCSDLEKNSTPEMRVTVIVTPD